MIFSYYYVAPNTLLQMIRRRISSDIQDLNKLHEEYWWIPNENMIRPSPKVLEDKKHFSNYVLGNWMSFRDFILDTHFKYPIDVEDGHICIRDHIKSSEWNFQKSLFPYNLPSDVNHYILWNSFHNYSANFDDSVINGIIKDTLEHMIGTNFDFAWYCNPKPSIPELYHVQVFWIKI
jgi:hypothetical protein